MTNIISSAKHFGGQTLVYQHASKVTQTAMNFGVYLPSQAKSEKLPGLVWLSGLTCTEQNFLTKAGAQRLAEELKLILIVPDTSPRGLNLPGEHDSYDFGSGAGFYLDATMKPWVDHYRMESYVTTELLDIATSILPLDRQRLGIFGHSMGGHGALTLGLKYPKIFKTISAFAPICNPVTCAWGQKAFTGYLGPDTDQWLRYDAVELLKYETPQNPILIDQGMEDEFLKEQLHAETLSNIVEHRALDVTIRYQEGYDHSYYFISTFIADHLEHHFRYLNPC